MGSQTIGHDLESFYFTSLKRIRKRVREGNGYPLQYSWISLVAQLVKNLLAMRETWVLSLGWKDPLEKGKAMHSSIAAWRIPWGHILYLIVMCIFVQYAPGYGYFPFIFH